MGYKELILDVIKNEMTTQIKNMTINTISETECQLAELLAHAKVLTLSSTDVLDRAQDTQAAVVSDDAETETKDITDLPFKIINHPVSTDNHKWTPTPEEGVGILRLNVPHGHIELPSGHHIFMPESIIRLIGAEDGDHIKFKVAPGKPRDNGLPRYHYSINKSRTTVPETNRVVFEKAIVKTKTKSDKPTLIITDDYAGNILEADGKYQLHHITENDINEFNLEDGDIVDLAWYDGSYEQSARVIWKYSEQQFNEYFDEND